MRNIQSRMLLIAVCLTGVMMLSLPRSLAESKKDPQPRIVTKIINVDCAVEKMHPPNLVVRAVSQVSTGGWTKARLVRVTYATAPEDGIQDYIMFAVPPSGAATQAFSKVEATNRWEGYADEAPWIKGVRVHGCHDGVLVRMLW